MIFELHGDELRLCVSQPRGGPDDKELPRPLDFSPGPGKMITVFKRQ
jgi:hypothetical protein